MMAMMIIRGAHDDDDSLLLSATTDMTKKWSNVVRDDGEGR